jgi:SsrA-binding protein
MKIITQNKKAEFNYEILEKFEVGIKLLGFEVKSVKNGHISLKGSFANFHDNELYLLNANISPYQPKNTPKEYDATRSRKLLLKKKEIKYLMGKIKERNLVLIPLKVFLKNNFIKIELGLGKGKKKYDKREKIIKRDTEREIGRRLKGS